MFLSSVDVVTADAPLRGALSNRLKQFGFADVRGWPDLYTAATRRPQAVISPVAELLPHIAAYLANVGIRVVALAAVPTPAEQLKYEIAGAAYVPMNINLAELVAALERSPTSAANNPRVPGRVSP